jgi:hypothetical protein
MEKPMEVWVAQGTYRPEQGSGVKAGDTKATFRLINGVTIRGGYAGLGQPDPNAWDPNEYETILNGDLQGNDDFQDNTTLSDNSLHIVTSIGLDETAVLEGVTIAHGAFLGTFFFDEENPPQGGAGLYNKSGSPEIRRCVFVDNYIRFGDGAAVFNDAQSSARFDRCIFANSRNGEAVANYESHCILRECRFIDNLSHAIVLKEATCELDGCLFRGNKQVAIRMYDESRATMSGCVFRANKGGVYGDQVECEGCVFEQNVSEWGGGIYVDRASLVDCLFRDNLGGRVGAVGATSSLQMTRCALFNNDAKSVGAVTCRQAMLAQCLFVGNHSSTGTGALGIYTGGMVSNCTFVGNRATALGIVDTSFAQEPTTLENCIFRDNRCTDASWPAIVGSSLMTVRYSNVTDLPDVWLGGTAAVANVDVDPLFADPGYWDPNGTPEDSSDDFFVEGDYHLKSQAGRWDPNSQDWVFDDVTSPCIDAGDPNSPAGDEPFPNGGRINMGAYGGTAEASRSYDAGASRED